MSKCERISLPICPLLVNDEVVYWAWDNAVLCLSDGKVKKTDLENGEAVLSLALFKNNELLLATDNKSILLLGSSQVFKTRRGISAALVDDDDRILVADRFGDVQLVILTQDLEIVYRIDTANNPLADDRETLAAKKRKIEEQPLRKLETPEGMPFVGVLAVITRTKLIGSKLYVADREGRLWIYQYPEMYICKTILVGHSDFVTDFVLIDEGKHAITASGDGTLCLWNCDDGTCLETVEIGNRQFVSVLTTHENFVYGLICGTGNVIRLTKDLKTSQIATSPVPLAGIMAHPLIGFLAISLAGGSLHIIPYGSQCAETHRPLNVSETPKLEWYWKTKPPPRQETLKPVGGDHHQPWFCEWITE